MADRYAVAAADASLPSTWNGGVSVPQAGDTVRPNGYVVPVTGTLIAGTITNAAGGGAVAGGSFDLRDGGVIQSAVTWGTGTPVITYAGSASASIIGPVGDTGTGANTSNGLVSQTGSGTLHFVGGWQGGSGSYNKPFVSSGVGNTTLVGSSLAGTGTYSAISPGALGTVHVTGDVGGGGSGAYGLTGGATGGMVTVTGCAIAATAQAIYMSGRPVTLLGDAMASAAAEAVTCGALTWHGGVARSASGKLPFNCASLRVSPAAQIQYEFTTSETPATQRSLYTANHPDSGADMPAESDVRALVTYDNGAMEGTCHVPAAAYTSLGVLVDDTVGTLVAADVAALTDATADLVELLEWLTPVIPDVHSVVIPAPTQPTSTVAWVYCYDEHGQPEKDVEITLFSTTPGTIGRAYTWAMAKGVSGIDGLVTVEIPRDPLLNFIGYRGGSLRKVRFQGVDEDTLQLPSMLGAP